MEENFVITEIFHVIMVGKNEYPEPKNSFGRKLRYNELIFHFSGHATVFFDDLTLKTASNTIRFLPAGSVSRYDVIDHEKGECIDVFFLADRPISPLAFTVDTSQGEKLGALFKRLFSTWVGKKEGYYFEAVSLLYRIFASMQKESMAPKQHVLKIEPAMKIINESFASESFRIGDLAAACNMGESYFLKLFKKVHGISPKRYIIGMKINHAADLLRLERYSVTDVAELSGFSDVYFFSRQFKEYMGITPTQFVEKYKSSK